MVDYAITPQPSERDMLNADSPQTYGVVREFPTGNKYIYCYTALTTILYGGCVAITRLGGDAAGQCPRVTVPATSAVTNLFGIAVATRTTAGGLWVQTRGRCDYARVAAVGINDALKPADGVQYLALDHTTTLTASGMAFAEEAQADAIAAQTDVTNGDPEVTIYLPERWATVA